MNGTLFYVTWIEGMAELATAHLIFGGLLVPCRWGHRWNVFVDSVDKMELLVNQYMEHFGLQ